MKDPISATVKFPGKLWPAGQYPAKVNAVFEADGKDYKVNAKPDTDKAAYLLSLSRGDAVVLIEESMKKDGGTIVYYNVDAYAMLAARSVSGQPGASTGRQEKIDKEYAKVKYFYGLGIQLVREVAEEQFGSEHLIANDSILENGRAVVISILMGSK